MIPVFLESFHTFTTHNRDRPTSTLQSPIHLWGHTREEAVPRASLLDTSLPASWSVADHRHAFGQGPDRKTHTIRLPFDLDRLTLTSDQQSWRCVIHTVDLHTIPHLLHSLPKHSENPRLRTITTTNPSVWGSVPLTARQARAD